MLTNFVSRTAKKGEVLDYAFIVAGEAIEPSLGGFLLKTQSMILLTMVVIPRKNTMC